MKIYISIFLLLITTPLEASLPPVADLIIEKSLLSINEAELYVNGQSKLLIENKKYLKSLRNDWSTTLKKDISDISPYNKTLHQSFTFYFNNSKDLNLNSVEQLLNPPLPLSLESLNNPPRFQPFYDLEHVETRKSGLLLRLMYIEAVGEIGVDSLFDVDDDLIVLSQIYNYLNEIINNSLVNEIPDQHLTTIYLPFVSSKMLGDNLSSGQTFNDSNDESNIKNALNAAVSNIYVDIWKLRPGHFNKEIDVSVQESIGEMLTLSKKMASDSENYENIADFYMILGEWDTFILNNKSYFESEKPKADKTSDSKLSDKEILMFNRAILFQSINGDSEGIAAFRSRNEKLRSVLQHYISSGGVQTSSLMRLNKVISELYSEYTKALSSEYAKQKGSVINT